MWDKPRSEIISVDTGRLAEHAFAQMGLVGIQMTTDGDRVRLSICPVSDKMNATDCMLLTRRDAEQLLVELVSEELASRDEAGNVVLDAVSAHDAIANCLQWHWWRIKPITGVEVEARIASVKDEIDRALVRMQSTGGMKLLNRQYKALRTGRAAGEKIPSFKNWLTAQLESKILQLLALPVL